MNRDNVLYLLVGLLAGFLVGYLAHEAMSGVQPQRVAAGAASVDPHSAGAVPTDGSGAGRMADLAELRELLDRDPDNREALLTLANMNFDIGAWARAQELYERLLRLEPGNADVLTDLGICLRSQGQFDGALQRFREARLAQPGHWQALYNEVVVHAFDRKDFAAAEPVLVELQRLAGNSPDVQRLVAEVERLKSAS